MTKYIAFLRGINVGGHKPVKMDVLAGIFTSLKFKNVKTLIVSGNVLFETAEKDGAALAKKIEAQLQKDLGYEIPVMLRTAGEIEKIVKANPFRKIKPSPDVKNYVAFLSGPPKVKAAIPKAPKGESWEILGVKGREVYVTTRKKADGHNGFPNNFIEKGLGVSATTRNWNTVVKTVQ